MSPRFLVVETPTAEFFAGDLFRKVFGGDPPDFPRHFVCLYRAGDGRLRTAGYVHFSAFESMHLVGGLVVDRSLYAEIPPEHLAELGPRRSIGELVMKRGIELLPPSVAVFAIIGDARSVQVNRDVGYVPTHLPNLYAYWRQALPPEVQRAAAERVMRIAPF